MWSTNVLGTETLLRNIKGTTVTFLCHLSSAGVIGRTDLKWVTEDAPCFPQNLYEESKLAAEKKVLEGIPGCRIVVLRPTNVISDQRPGAFALPMRRSFRNRLHQLIKGAECAHLVHAVDVAAAALFLSERSSRSGECYFVSCDDDPLNTFAGVSAVYQGRLRAGFNFPLAVPHLLRKLQSKPSNRGDVRYSSEKLLREGFRYSTGIREVARRLLERRKNLKILTVNMSLDPKDGGTSERTLQLSRALLKSGCDVRLLTTAKGLPPSLTEEFGDRLVALPILSERFYIPRSGYARISELVSNVDVIHLMNHWNLLNVLVYFEARRQSKPYVVCPAGALPLFGRSIWLKQMYNIAVGRAIIRDAAGVIAVTEKEIQSILEYGVNRAAVSVFPNGIDSSGFEDDQVGKFRETYGLAEKPFFLFLGRLAPIKGPDLLLEAFVQCARHVEGWDLVFAGPDGGELEKLRKRVVQTGLSGRVHFIGHVSGNLKSQALHAAGVVVIPSRQEAQSIVVLEAGICGTPVILSNQCGFDSAAQVGGGWSVAPNAEQIAEALIQAVNNQNRLKAMGLKLKSYCAEKYSWDALAPRYISYFEKIMGG